MNSRTEGDDRCTNLHKMRLNEAVQWRGAHSYQLYGEYVDIYAYIPPSLSILLIVSFRLFSGYYERAIEKWARSDPGWNKPEVVGIIKRIALDCAVQFNFASSMILAGSSILVLLSTEKAQAFLIITLILYIVAVISLIFVVARYDTGELVEQRTKTVQRIRYLQPLGQVAGNYTVPVTKKKIKRATWLDCTIVSVNILVIVAIVITQHQT